MIFLLMLVVGGTALVYLRGVVDESGLRFDKKPTDLDGVGELLAEERPKD